MKSEIRSIYTTTREGAYGDDNKIGRWIYGALGHGRKSRVRSRKLLNGNQLIFSTSKNTASCETEFTRDEWIELCRAEDGGCQEYICNQILDKRNKK